MKTMFTRLAVVALCLATVVTSCKKNDDEPVTPIDPVEIVFMPTVITHNGIPMDSFVYNDDYTISKFFTADEDLKTYTYNFEFFYDNNKVCRKVKVTDVTKGSETDTLIYQDNKILRVRTFNGSIPSAPDSLYIQLNANKQVTLVGSKDTLQDKSPEYRYLNYLEFIYNNGNWATFTNKDGSFYKGPDGSTRNSVYTTTLNYTYDAKPNPLKPLFTINPVMYYYFYEGADLIHSCGTNNISKIEGTLNANGATTPVTYNFTATFNADGTLKEQKVNDGTSEMVIGYKWVKAN